MAQGKVHHLRLHRGATIKWLQNWFLAMHEKHIGGPANAPTAAQIVDECLQLEYELRSQPQNSSVLRLRDYEADVKEMAMRLFEKTLHGFSMILDTL